MAHNCPPEPSGVAVKVIQSTQAPVGLRRFQGSLLRSSVFVRFCIVLARREKVYPAIRVVRVEGQEPARAPRCGAGFCFTLLVLRASTDSTAALVPENRLRYDLIHSLPARHGHRRGTSDQSGVDAER